MNFGDLFANRKNIHLSQNLSNSNSFEIKRSKQVGKILCMEYDNNNPYKINYVVDTFINPGFTEQVKESIEIVESILKKFDNSKLPDAEKLITITETSFDNPSTLGSASLSLRQININVNNFSDTNEFFLNVTPKNINIIVLVHEIIHILGVGSSVHFFNNIEGNFYLGENGVKQYKKVLANNSYERYKEITKVPIENSFGAGTIGSHFEEGQDTNNNTEFIFENGLEYPSVPNEIMTGFINLGFNFLSIMTLGVLEDIGWTVDYNSNYVFASPPLQKSS